MPAAMDARGYVYLRLGKFDKAIADFTDLLKANPKAATSLYGRGLAQLHKGLTAEGQKDLDGATALDAARVEHLRHFGLAP